MARQVRGPQSGEPNLETSVCSARHETVTLVSTVHGWLPHVRQPRMCTALHNRPNKACKADSKRVYAGKLSTAPLSGHTMPSMLGCAVTRAVGLAPLLTGAAADECWPSGISTGAVSGDGTT